MSVQDIVKYVIKTPGNTNPNVIKSMVEDEMNTTLQMAKAYTDSQRLGYTEEQYETVLDISHAFATQLATSTTYPDTKFTGTEKLYEVGYTNYVYWDGKLYACRSESDADNGYSHIYIGNFAKYAKVGDTGEPFCLVAMATGMWMLYCYDKLDETHTIRLCEETEVIHKIDPKFLPGVCLPVVELTTKVPPMEFVPLTEAESAQLDALNGELCILKCVCDDGVVAFPVFGIASRTEYNGAAIYSVHAAIEGAFTVMVAKNGDNWQALFFV